MKITTKSQVTIPQDVRDEFGFLPNTDVEFVRDGKGGVLLKNATGAGTAWGRARGGHAQPLEGHPEDG